MNAYELLECKIDASPDELKAAYHRLLLIHHPDKVLHREDDKSIDTFLKLHSAYKILSDVEQRKAYDSMLKQISLKQYANDRLDQEDFFLLNKDFELCIDNEFYTRKCRCGSVYKIRTKDLHDILATYQHDSLAQLAESLIVAVECDTCSLTVNVLII